MIAPIDVAKAASKLQGHMTSNVNNISQRAAIAAVSGSLDAVYEMREAFDKRRQTIVAALNDIEGVNCPTPTGAFYAFADVSALLNKPLGASKAPMRARPSWLRHCLTKAMWRPFQVKRSVLLATCDSRMRLPTTIWSRA